MSKCGKEWSYDPAHADPSSGICARPAKHKGPCAGHELPGDADRFRVALHALLSLAQAFAADSPCALVGDQVRSCLAVGAIEEDALCGPCLLAWRIRKALEAAE